MMISAATTTTATGAAALCAAALAAIVVVLRRSLARPPPATSPHRLYIGKTHHARFAPARHAFNYAVLHVALNLSKLESSLGGILSHGGIFPRWWLLGLDSRWFTLFSIRTADYLVPVPDSPDGGTLLQRAQFQLTRLGVPEDSYGSIELITTPRFLGIAFNPLNTYYVYGRDESASELVAVLLEVNNTFKERHVYLLDSRNQQSRCRSGYTVSHKVRRAFHVSPFNNRSGVYESHILNPRLGDRHDLLLILREYENDDTTTTNETPRIIKEDKRMVARVWGRACHLDATALVACAMLYPLEVLLVVPRIMFEAWRLAYRRRLRVFQRPNPLDADRTVVWKPWGAYEVSCLRIFVGHLGSVCGGAVRVVVSGQPWLAGVCEDGAGKAGTITITLHSPRLPVKLATWGCDETGVMAALLTTYANGDWDTDDLVVLLRALECPDDRVVKNDDASTALSIARRHWSPKQPTLPSVRLRVVAVSQRKEDWFWQCKGMATDALERAWFRHSTNFVVDPNDLSRRVEGYLSGRVEGVARESERTLAFWRVVEGLSAEE